ncbi:MAG: hypothetical protein OXF33_02155 [Rhodospirillales bacterium]|nr:hypothetical protein [Rhodospirillales bacterium]
MAVTLSVDDLRAAIGSDLDTATRLLPVATELVERFAPDAPESIQNEGTIRVAGWLAEAPSSGVRSEAVGDIRTSWSPSSPVPMRASGAMALLAPWKSREAGVVE